MTVSTTIIKNSHNGNGSTTTFAYSFKIFADSDLVVIIRSSTGTETTKTLTTHYTVTGAGSASGGTVVFTSGNIPASGETVVIRRNVPQTQVIDYIANDPFPAETHEEGLDRNTMIAQQVSEATDRSIKLSRTNTMTSTEFTVGATDRANKVLSFDSSGELAVTQELGTFRGNWSASTAYQVRDLVKDTSTNNIFIVNTAHTSSGSQPLTTNTNSAKYDLIVDAATATTSSTSAANSATAAANSATASANSATASANSASAASTSETNAASSASTASTQATNSANSATASANSASAAAATFDLFDDSYLGAKSSNPTVDNDGNALQDGALYFDTTNDVMKVYNLSTTTWLQLTPTVSNQNNINTVAGISSNVTSVANISSDVTTVAGISSDVQAVENISANVTSVANIDSNVTTVAGIASNVTSVAGISSNVTTVAGISSAVSNVSSISSAVSAVNSNSSNINTVAGSITNVNNVGGSIANVNTVATNLASVNNFGEVYRIASSAPTTSLNSGDLYFNTSTNVLNVYGASGWQNAGSSVNGTSQRYNYTATNGQTTFTGSDNNSNTLAYDAGYIDVYLNGVKLLNGTDVTVTSGSSVVLASGATTGDVVDIVAYGTFSVASLNADNLTSGTVPSARVSGAYTGITQTGTLASFASTGIDDNATSTAITINSSEYVGINTTNPQRQLHIQGNDGASGTSPGNSDAQVFIDNANSNGAMIEFGASTNGAGRLKFSDAGGNNRGSLDYLHNGDAFRFGVAGSSENMRLTSTGLGIGTSSPSAKLHVDVSNSGVTPNSYANTLFIESSSNTGLTIASGTSSYSSIYFANSTDNDKARIEVVHSDNSMRFTNNASERMRIDSSGNVGINTSSPSEKLHVNGHIKGNSLNIPSNTSSPPSGVTIHKPANDIMAFRTASTERMRLTSQGSMLMGTTSTQASTPNIYIHAAGAMLFLQRKTSNGHIASFINTAGSVNGRIDIDGSNTTYATSSDHRLKENVDYTWDATTRLKQLRPARFNWISDETNTLQDGFIAHEVSSVVPKAVIGTHNEVDADGNPVYQSIDHSMLVPLLVKTIQELEARITTLENA